MQGGVVAARSALPEAAFLPGAYPGRVRAGGAMGNFRGNYETAGALFPLAVRGCFTLTPQRGSAKLQQGHAATLPQKDSEHWCGSLRVRSRAL